MPDIEYEFVTNSNQVGDAPKLRREPVILPEWPRKNGKASAYYMYELSTGEHGELDVSDQVLDENNQVVRFKGIAWAIRFLAFCTRDPGGNRIWPTIEQAEEVLAPLGKSITNKMVQAAQKANYGDASSAKEAAERAEGNSEETSTSS